MGNLLVLGEQFWWVGVWLPNQRTAGELPCRCWVKGGLPCGCWDWVLLCRAASVARLRPGQGFRHRSNWAEPLCPMKLEPLAWPCPPGESSASSDWYPFLGVPSANLGSPACSWEAVHRPQTELLSLIIGCRHRLEADPLALIHRARLGLSPQNWNLHVGGPSVGSSHIALCTPVLWRRGKSWGEPAPTVSQVWAQLP